ncbi:hypothetical protein DM01DRAFT_1184841 [Hesseltinella vesiculosa]|uniref:Uncharacterized protein n=1 Tax=Hesseltinella vesiculosa TaxID=101127 RepID=A0A1X2GQN4_9FUNG|nr:hypothetical protein DM01DRAFT_1184841 [Hesseltinella vesiculosa]
MNQSHYDSIDIHIRWSDRQDLIIQVAPTDAIHTLKEKVQASVARSFFFFTLTHPFLNRYNIAQSMFKTSICD